MTMVETGWPEAERSLLFREVVGGGHRERDFMGAVLGLRVHVPRRSRGCARSAQLPSRGHHPCRQPGALGSCWARAGGWHGEGRDE